MPTTIIPNLGSCWQTMPERNTGPFEPNMGDDLRTDVYPANYALWVVMVL
jgi:hypothetical protein